MAVGVLRRLSPMKKTASEEEDRFAFSICFAGLTGVRGSQAILTPLCSLFVEIAHAIKAALQILRPLPHFVTNRLALGIAAPGQIRNCGG